MDELRAAVQRYELTAEELAWLTGRRDRFSLVRLLEQEDYATADHLMATWREERDRT